MVPLSVARVAALPRESTGASRGDWGLTLEMEALDELASALRGRLIERARSGEAAGGALEDEVRTLVESEAAPLPEDERRALGERVLLLATGLGPLEPLLSDPRVDEVMVNGPDAVYVERGGQDRAHGGQLRLRGRADARDRADPRPAGAAGGRGLAAVRRAAARRVARERGDPAAVAGRRVPDDPALSPRGLLAARPGGRRHAVAGGGRAAGGGGGRAGRRCW